MIKLRTGKLLAKLPFFSLQADTFYDNSVRKAKLFLDLFGFTKIWIIKI